MTEARAASLNPSDAVQGGLLDDVDVIIESARFCLWDYQGKAPVTAALRVNYRDAEDHLHEQYYSAGDPSRFVPSDDGCKLLLTGTATALNTTSNLVQYTTSLVNAGFPAAKLGDNISVIDGLRAHVQRVTQQKRAGLSDTTTGDREKTILLISKILAMPGEKVKPIAAGKPVPLGTAPKAATGAPTSAPQAAAVAAPRPAAVSAPASDDALSGKTIDYVVQAAIAAGGSISRQAISQKVFQLAMQAKDADKAVVCKMAFDEAFLSANAGPRFSPEDGAPLPSYEYDPTTKAITADVPVAA